MKLQHEIYKSIKKTLYHAMHEIKKIDDFTSLNNFKSKYLGKNSILYAYFSKLTTLEISERKKFSILLNGFKKKIQDKINYKKKKLQDNKIIQEKNKHFLDCTLPGRRIEKGNLHPLTIVINEIKKFFNCLGFKTFYGPEIENTYYNFDALNIPNDHPTKSMNDTFWFDVNHVLRTQTSSMQIRILEKYSVPIRAIVPGKVYRRDYDHTHTPMFHQIEGLIVDTAISFSHLKWILENFIIKILNKNVKVRFRSSYFPFTCPSAEMDIQDKHGKWLEILGCGMVHPNVLKHCNIDSNVYLGGAFGIGVERIAMLKYSVSDIRCFFENDVRFLKQFCNSEKY
ncbi:Phenylalanine--tRNA ligase alpha subunit [Buchnera aphidicola (Cinara pseudotaxifoliae)]|uniref:Phenylalanine--tRNA ligase alpha subunit n=2 Tax=Buchnera aphidicola TaxID=9 RepID=A0A451DGE7_9GAMM|nr:Phenylalanine--tRNA ligase alpha subunit [Buchnera aphidicola (Cinara pseudotaxifoliae)]